MEAITTTIRARGLSPSRLVAIADRLEKDVGAAAIPGAMIVIGSHNRVIFERTVGFRDVAEGDPLRPDAIWRIYSMTKPIVTAAAMVMVEAGLLCCDQPVVEFIPLFAQLRVADGAGGDVPARTPPTISGPHAPYGGPLVRLSWRWPGTSGLRSRRVSRRGSVQHLVRRPARSVAARTSAGDGLAL